MTWEYVIKCGNVIECKVMNENVLLLSYKSVYRSIDFLLNIKQIKISQNSVDF